MVPFARLFSAVFAVQEFARPPPPIHKKQSVFSANQPRKIGRRIKPSSQEVCKPFCFIQIQNPRLIFSLSQEENKSHDQEASRIEDSLSCQLARSEVWNESELKQQIYSRIGLIHWTRLHVKPNECSIPIFADVAFLSRNAKRGIAWQNLILTVRAVTVPPLIIWLAACWVGSIFWEKQIL